MDLLKKMHEEQLITQPVNISIPDKVLNLAIKFSFYSELFLNEQSALILCF